MRLAFSCVAALLLLGVAAAGKQDFSCEEHWNACNRGLEACMEPLHRVR